jgi:regulator of protease activity HflC (stomatin/prohibitin superfamily)
MKYLIVILAVLVSLGFWGSFAVDDLEVAAVKNVFSHKIDLYTTGVHYAIPLINKVDYITLSPDASDITMQFQDVNSHKSYRIDALAIWQVTNPKLFYSYLSAPGSINKALSNIIKGSIEQQVAMDKSITNLNHLDQLINQPILINVLGIKLNNVYLTQVSLGS